MENKKLISPPRLTRCFSSEEIQECINNDRLLSLSIKLPVNCNLKCRYCYSSIKNGDMSFVEFEELFRQASALGVRSVSIIGEGEPLLYKDKKHNKNILDIIRVANDFKLGVIIFTNNILINDFFAKKLYELDVCMVCKLNSFIPAVQDFLSGVEGSYAKISRGLEFLKQRGFAKTSPSRLSVHTIICRQNYDCIASMWENFRRNLIIPYVQVLVPPANKNLMYFNELKVSKSKIKKLFIKLSEIDKKFGFIWDPENTYPIAGLGCSVVKTGCCISSNASVQMCGYLDEELGNIREQSLVRIITSDKVRRIRKYNYTDKINSNSTFYGCRATAFNLTGDRFAQDPFF